MSSQIWDPFLTARDSEVIGDSGFSARAGFGARPALLVVDVTYAFCGDAPMPVEQAVKRWRTACGEEAWTAVAAIRRLINAAHARGLPVIYTTHKRRADGWDRGSGAWKNSRSPEDRDPRRHGRDREAIVDEIAPAPHDIVINKSKPSAFFATPLMSQLTLLGADSLIVTGGTTSGCVRASVVDAFSHNLRVSVPAAAVFDRCQASHAVNLLDMQTKYADVVTLSETESYLQGLPDGLFELPAGGR